MHSPRQLDLFGFYALSLNFQLLMNNCIVGSPCKSKFLRKILIALVLKSYL